MANPNWVEGKSGNPSGRPKMPEELREAFRASAPKALATLMDVLETGDKASDRLRAAEILLNRGYGMPVQSVEAEITDLRPITFAPVLGKLTSGTDTPAD